MQADSSPAEPQGKPKLYSIITQMGRERIFIRIFIGKRLHGRLVLGEGRDKGNSVDPVKCWKGEGSNERPAEPEGKPQNMKTKII